jgi:hypothetical protein
MNAFALDANKSQVKVGDFVVKKTDDTLGNMKPSSPPEVGKTYQVAKVSHGYSKNGQLSIPVSGTPCHLIELVGHWGSWWSNSFVKSELQEAYDLGYEHGFNDTLDDCPFVEDSPENDEYYRGYEEGCRQS